MHGKKKHQLDAKQVCYSLEQDVDSPELHTTSKND